MSRYHHASRVVAESEGARREREIDELNRQFEQPSAAPSNRGLYQQLLAADVPLDSHESDLYVKVTPESSRIVEESGHSSTMFTSEVDGKLWYDLPFAYEPFWDREQRRTSAITAAKSRKPVFGHHDGMSYAVKVDSLDSNEFFKQPLGRQLDDAKRLRTWKDGANTAWVGAKGKSTMSAIRRWIKENKPAEFYAKWKSDAPIYKDDSVEIHYR